jgi:hypothetical protein
MVSKAPTNVGIEVKDLTNFSTLVWTAPEGKSVYYHILVRETSSQHWEKTIFVKIQKL